MKTNHKTNFKPGDLVMSSGHPLGNRFPSVGIILKKTFQDYSNSMEDCEPRLIPAYEVYWIEYKIKTSPLEIYLNRVEK